MNYQSKTPFTLCGVVIFVVNMLAAYLCLTLTRPLFGIAALNIVLGVMSLVIVTVWEKARH